MEALLGLDYREAGKSAPNGIARIARGQSISWRAIMHMQARDELGEPSSRSSVVCIKPLELPLARFLLDNTRARRLFVATPSSPSLRRKRLVAAQGGQYLHEAGVPPRDVLPVLAGGGRIRLPERW